jgi:hypothetical protein
MALSQLIQTLSVEAGSAVDVYRFVVQAADGQYDYPSAQGLINGIAAETIATVGDALAMVIPNGAIAKIEAGAAVAINAKVASDATGRAITAVSGAGNYRGGIALDAASAAGEIIRIQFLVDEDQVT